MMPKFPDDPLTRRSLLTTITTVGGLIVLLRMALLGIWCVVSEKSISENIWVEIALSILADLAIAAIVTIGVLYYGKRARTQVTNEFVVLGTTAYVVTALALLLISGIVPNEVESNRITNFLDVVTVNTIAVGLYIVTVTLAGILVTLILAKRHKRTTAWLIFNGLLLFGIWLCTILGELTGVFKIIAIVLGFVSLVLTLTQIGKLPWLSTLTLDKKFRLIWLSMCGALASSIFGSILLFDDGSYLSISAHNFVRSGGILPAVIAFIGFVFFVRLFIGTILALPNSGIVDRRSSEVESLAALTRLISESASVHQLLSQVTHFSSKVCKAHGAWCELYTDGELQVIGAELVHPEYVRTLHGNHYLSKLFSGNERPFLIGSLQDSHRDAADATVIRSLITIPLVSHHHRVGTLVMFSTVDFGFEQDDLRLLTAFGDAIGVGLDQARLMETAIENERIQKEFDVARNIQSSLLPHVAPLASRCEFDAVMIPAAQVGGDYFDYIKFGNGRIGAIIADVSGKGVPAALYMATLKGVVLAEARAAAGPADLLRRINTTLWGSMERSTYISMMCVEFDPDRMVLKMSRAGHTPALLRLGGQVVTMAPQGTAIGILKPDQFDRIIEEIDVPVASGDVCLLTTQGVNERRNENYSEMTFEPVTNMLTALENPTARGLITATQELLDKHGNGTDQHDDITIVGIVFTSGETLSEPTRIPKTVGETA